MTKKIFLFFLVTFTLQAPDRELQPFPRALNSEELKRIMDLQTQMSPEMAKYLLRSLTKALNETKERLVGQEELTSVFVLLKIELPKSHEERIQFLKKCQQFNAVPECDRQISALGYFLVSEAKNKEPLETWSSKFVDQRETEKPQKNLLPPAFILHSSNENQLSLILISFCCSGEDQCSNFDHWSSHTPITCDKSMCHSHQRCITPGQSICDGVHKLPSGCMWPEEWEPLLKEAKAFMFVQMKNQNSRTPLPNEVAQHMLQFLLPGLIASYK